MAVAMLIIGAVVLFAATALPHASITVHPKTAEKKITKDILLTASATTPDYVRYALPAKIVEQESHVSKTITKSTANIKQGFSKGTVMFKNEQDDEQRLLPKTHLKHEGGSMFITDTPVTIPPHGEVEVHVTAEQQGKSGDVAPGRFNIDKFSAGLQRVVYATSATTFSGGEFGDSPITQADIDEAKKAVLEQAKQEAIAAINKQSASGSIREDLITTEIKSNTASAQAGSNAISFTAEASVQARGFLTDTQDIISLMTLALRASVAGDEEFSSFDPASFSLAIAQTDWKTGQARITSSLTGTYAKKIGSSELSEDNLAGLSKQELINHFTTFPSIGSVDVVFSPFWVKSAPSKQNQITITVARGK
jgi:hypothetical protein